jgi:hypothetical protein
MTVRISVTYVGVITVFVTIVVPQPSTPQPATAPQSAQPAAAPPQASHGELQLDAHGDAQQELLRNNPALAGPARLTHSRAAAVARLVIRFVMDAPPKTLVSQIR